MVKCRRTTTTLPDDPANSMGVNAAPRSNLEANALLKHSHPTSSVPPAQGTANHKQQRDSLQRMIIHWPSYAGGASWRHQASWTRSWFCTPKRANHLTLSLIEASSQPQSHRPKPQNSLPSAEFFHIAVSVGLPPKRRPSASTKEVSKLALLCPPRLPPKDFLTEDSLPSITFQSWKNLLIYPIFPTVRHLSSFRLLTHQGCPI